MRIFSQSWLHQLVNSQQALYWPWRHSLRLVLISTVPMTVGFLTGHLTIALFMCLGGLLSAISVQTDPYAARFLRIFIAIPFGVCGFFFGALIAGHGFLTVAGVVFIALVSGWISFWGKNFSAGALQMLVLTVLAAHLPPAAVSIELPALFVCGALYAAFLLAIEALLIPKQPEKKLISLVFASLAKLARIAATPSGNDVADSVELSAALHAALEHQCNAFNVLVGLTSDDGKNVDHFPVGKEVLATLDQLTVAIAQKQADAADLLLLAQALDDLAQFIVKRHSKPLESPVALRHSDLSYSIAWLFQMTQSHLVFQKHKHASILSSVVKELAGLNEVSLAAQIRAQRSNFINILSLGLCMFVAMLAELHLPGNRSYWIPLSVAVILKPDFGSVFVRAVQRSLGTLVGVLFAILIFYFVPKGLLLVLVIGVLSALIPWASLKSYAWQCAFLTPLILILIDLIIAGPTIDYGPQRLIDTVLGALIVLVFGYFIWPKPIKISFAQRYQKVLLALQSYCNALRVQQPPSETNRDLLVFSKNYFEAVLNQRQQSYVALFTLRKWVQSFLAEPPPVSKEAGSWLPMLDQTQALMDKLDWYIFQCGEQAQAPSEEVLASFQDQIDRLSLPIRSHRPLDSDPQ